jgi:tRNA(Arg) A34 adenosine deaminase TadA
LARINPVERPLPKICAVLTDHTKQNVYIGFNSRKTHPLQLKFNPHNPSAIHLHAELDAIRKAVRVHGGNLSDFSLYVARVHRSGQVALAKPCKGCQGAIVAFGIKDIQWTN